MIDSIRRIESGIDERNRMETFYLEQMREAYNNKDLEKAQSLALLSIAECLHSMLLNKVFQ